MRIEMQQTMGLPGAYSGRPVGSPGVTAVNFDAAASSHQQNPAQQQQFEPYPNQPPPPPIPAPPQSMNQMTLGQINQMAQQLNQPPPPPVQSMGAPLPPPPGYTSLQERMTRTPPRVPTPVDKDGDSEMADEEQYQQDVLDLDRVGENNPNDPDFQKFKAFASHVTERIATAATTRTTRVSKSSTFNPVEFEPQD